MRYYLAGPMTGIPHYNAHSFIRVGVMWRALDHDLWTPFDSLDEVWNRYSGCRFDFRTDVCENDHAFMPEVVAANMREIVARDGIILLDGWERSRGAQLEVMAAITFGKKLRTAGGEPIVRIPKLTFYDPTTRDLTDSELDTVMAALRQPDPVQLADMPPRKG